MKAIRIHGPKDARFEEVPTPEPGLDEVLVRVRAVAICATDVELYDGVMFYITSGMTKYPFKAYGARKVILVDRADDRLEVGRELGADVTVNIDVEDLVEKVRDATGGHMVDVVIEAVGRKEVWPAIASILAPRARVAMTGLFAGPKCEVDFDPLVVTEVSILGCLGGPNLWTEAIALHASDKVRTAEIITHRLPLADFARGIEIARHRGGGAIKVLIEV